MCSRWIPPWAVTRVDCPLLTLHTMQLMPSWFLNTLSEQIEARADISADSSMTYLMERECVLCSIYLGAYDAAELTITVGSTVIVVNTQTPLAGLYTGNNPPFNTPFWDATAYLWGAAFSTVGMAFPGLFLKRCACQSLLASFSHQLMLAIQCAKQACIRLICSLLLSNTLRCRLTLLWCWGTSHGIIEHQVHQSKPFPGQCARLEPILCLWRLTVCSGSGSR